ncbi:hypothetical protein BD289DRAFT_47581 [Coniella lustricola]|uniref:T6SS Phospholipase effector Tle1-like catalytic domain-containing protein n=1 Tax=Coniella lustricola TaxID=2025994 RepID=A0A2T3AIM8_9PEZI|nr:hypothetical protein BD289DRAFT_47581 [Coniella lustricola]
MDGGMTVQRSRPNSKRIIVCCDGTWKDSNGADEKPLTNVTRLARSLKQTCADGTHQVIFYQAGVGTGGNLLDTFTGGVFGTGLAQDIKEAYNYICTNYVDGDDIVLVGFSRGAFTARSVADLVASIGLLNTEGMVHFYAIFNDYENMADKHRKPSDFLDDSYKYLRKYNGEQGKDKILWENHRKDEYRAWLIKRRWTRDMFRDGSEIIKIKAVAVWETVGSLGIPITPVIGLHGSSAEWRFTNTQISSKVEYAFQALALDEPRASFRPALWERLDENTTTYLKQVWFPGSHSNVGGGWYDQQIACITLAWICDQLTPLGIEFSYQRLTKVFYSSLRYSAAHPYPYIPSPTFAIPSKIWALFLEARVPRPWAFSPIPCPHPKSDQRVDLGNCTGKDHHPRGTPAQLWKYQGRPWGFGQTRYPTSKLELLGGTSIRRPGCFMRVDVDTNEDTTEPLLNTNERIHSCVRVRLELDGMSMDDRQTWQCTPLSDDDSRKGHAVWRLINVGAISQEEKDDSDSFWIGELANARKDYDLQELYRSHKGDGNWKWAYDKHALVKNGVGKRVEPRVETLPEEPMAGYWERHLLALTVGEYDVWRLAEDERK